MNSGLKLYQAEVKTCRAEHPDWTLKKVRTHLKKSKAVKPTITIPPPAAPIQEIKVTPDPVSVSGPEPVKVPQAPQTPQVEKKEDKNEPAVPVNSFF
jgi:hypothetical protein